jgi:D-3-phosphoglycerate dehydrogenase
MRVIGYDPYIDPDRLPFVEFVSSVESLLAQSDFVSLNLALTPDTRGLMDATRFAQIKRGAYFINCSRGGTVNEPALYDALMSGHLAGAALDVYEVEPPALDHPLWTLPNVIATPHVASFTDMGLRLMSEGVVDQLEQLAHGERPTHVVNLQALPGRLADWLL